MIQDLLFLIPAAFANMAPVFFRKVPFLNWPVDLGKKFNGRRIFGDNKTYRGLLAGILVAYLIAYLQSTLGFFEYPLYTSILLGLGALLGDLSSSFIKRQAGKKPGERMIVLDQLDWVIGTLVLFSFYALLPLEIYVSALILLFFLHILVKHLGYFLGLDDNKW
ncbi:MAG: CDP-archaeol synthase [Nanobdellota archaeon]